MLPLSLSYDHRLIDGADAPRASSAGLRRVRAALRPGAVDHGAVHRARRHRRRPGWYAGGVYAADLGMRVTLVDPEAQSRRVCLYRGCIPSKALLHVADVVNEAKPRRAVGRDVPVLRRSTSTRCGHSGPGGRAVDGGVGQIAKLRKIAYIQGRAAFRDATSLDVALEAGGSVA